MNWCLRPVETDDLDDVYTLCCIPEVYRYLADGAPPPIDLIRQWIERSNSDFVAHGVGLWLLENDEGRAAGGVSLEVQETDRTAELVYLLHPEYWGRGLATQMSWTVMQHAFDLGRIEEIIAGTDAPNKASLAVMKRLGMRFRRDVTYPMGAGVEYVRTVHDPLPVRAPEPIFLKSI